MKHCRWMFVAGALLSASALHAQSFLCEDSFKLSDADMAQYQFGPQLPPPPPPKPVLAQDETPVQLRMLKYAAVAVKHKLEGLASYYSTSLNGTLTANGERYYNKQLSAAHLTLPLGCWIEVKSLATGRKVRVRVNDRGPYVNKFVLDLSQAAARAIGVDVAADRRVAIRIIALPGEDPLPEGPLETGDACLSGETQTAAK
jgi:rare lipoprotein A